MPSGSYVYGDFCTGEIFLLNDGNSSLIFDTGLNISSFGEDEAGEIYVVGIGGTIHRFRNANGLPQSFTITNAIVRRRSSGEVLDPLTVQKNGKKFEIVVFEEGPAPTPESVDAKVLVNGSELKTTYTTTATGTPVFVARLKKRLLRNSGALSVMVIRKNGTSSNQLQIPILPEQ